jgi:hypothetical protein
MNLDAIKEALHLDKIANHDIQAGGLLLIAIIVIIIAFKIAKSFFKTILFIAALACIGAAIWSHYRS